MSVVNKSSILLLKKLGKTSNASNFIVKLSSTLPIQYKFKSIIFYSKWSCGRSMKGRIIVKSKGPRIKLRTPVINYSYRNLSLFFVAGINYTGFYNKVASIIFNSQGGVTYLTTKINDSFFLLSNFKKVRSIVPHILKDVTLLKPFIQLNKIPLMILQQQKNLNVSNIELKPLTGIQYTRSIGSKSQIVKLDTRTGLSLVKLSSGLYKVFSIFSLCSSGSSALVITKGKLKNSKSGFWRKKGKKPNVRGVAMNPIDHPHGGRTTAIKYPRTPWGKTTKFK